MKRFILFFSMMLLIASTGVFISCSQEVPGEPADFTVGTVDSTVTITPTNATGGNSYVTITTTKTDGSVTTTRSTTAVHATTISELASDTTLANTMIARYQSRATNSLAGLNAAQAAYQADTVQITHWTTRKAQAAAAITTVGGY